MNDAALFEATVPVFQHYLTGVEKLLTTLSDEHVPLLQERVVTHAFTASEHLQTAINFVPRTVLPLLGQELADAEDGALGRDDLPRLANSAGTLLRTLSSTDFDGASSRIIQHTAGDANLSQGTNTFVTMFALPNFFFHLSMAFAILRQGGCKNWQGRFRRTTSLRS